MHNAFSIIELTVSDLLHQSRDLMGGILLCHALPYLLDLVLIIGMVRIVESEKVELRVASFVETNAIFKLGTWEWKKWCVCVRKEGGGERERD